MSARPNYTIGTFLCEIVKDMSVNPDKKDKHIEKESVLKNVVK